METVHPDDKSHLRDVFISILNEYNSQVTIEYRYKRKDETYVPVQLTAKNLLNNPDIKGVLINYHDISKQKEYEADLKMSEERFKALHNASFGGIAIHDQGLILECNKGLTEITGYREEELIGMNGLLLIAESTRDKVLENIKSGYEKPYEAIGVKKDGTEYPIRLEARNIYYKGEKVRVVEFRDLSEIKSLEDQLRQAQKIESIGHLAGGIAHDFNNLLTPIIGHSEFALTNLDPTNALYGDIHDIYDTATRAADLTSQLLAFSRKQILQVKLVDPNKTIANFKKILQRTIREDIEIKMQFCKSKGFIKVDVSQIEQILMNLFVNAQDAMPDGGVIFLETDYVKLEETNETRHPNLPPGDFFQISVSDTGVGMTKECSEKIFDPFFTTKEEGKGTGLGLSTTYGIVKQHGGFIWVYSEVGQGTTFKISLPVVEGDLSTEIKLKTDLDDYSGKGTVLIVEDQDQVRRVAERILKKFNYDVYTADSGKKAIKLIKDQKIPIDLLLTDIVMPDMNGRELNSILSEIYPGFKVLFMSGYTQDVISHHGMMDEDINFIQKPLTVDTLAKKVKEVLSG